MSDSSGALFAAFASVLDEMRALSKESLVPLTFDVPHAISVIVSAYPELEPYKARLAELPGFRMERFELLPVYANASTYIQGNYSKSTKRNPEETARLKLGLKLRGEYRSDAAGLVRRNLLSSARVSEVPRGTSFGSVGFGIVGLSNIFRERWSIIDGKVPFTLADLDASEIVAQDLIAIDSRIGEKTKSESADLRRRCITLLVNAFSEAERGLTYLLWDDPKLRAELIPSIRTKPGEGRGGAGGKGKAQPKKKVQSGDQPKPEKAPVAAE